MSDNRSIRIAYIGGGSQNFGWQFISALSGEELEGTVMLYDIDKQLSLTNEVIGNKMREQETNKSDIVYIATDTIEDALTDADFVILSISEGTLDEKINDIYLPEKFGIVQSSAENAGPGGIIRGLRTIPSYIKIAEAIKEKCPDAWVINLTNPMNICLMTLYDVFPEIKAFGSTNEPFASTELIADFISKESNLPKVHRREIKTNLVGINGFSFFTEIYYNGEDVMDIYTKFNKNFSEMGYEKHTNEFKNNPLASGNLVKFDMFMRYNAITAADDRHVAECCPPWYLSTQKNAQNWKIGMMNSNYMKRRKLELADAAKKLMNGESELKTGYAGTDVVNQIKALMGMKNLVTNVDAVNKGQASNLPLGAIVQTNALISKNSVKPVVSGDLPEELMILAARQISNQKILMKAAKEKDLDIAFNAFLNDTLMTLPIDSATELYKEMLSGIRSHLIYYCN
ncbi:MAG: alpha-glucosidase/alpha-galactosidase [Oscillospiraceae bacterium]|nr:alpha-glucosidase/alpha-galactosidase [Oscillospiraceae bacterium]